MPVSGEEAAEQELGGVSKGISEKRARGSSDIIMKELVRRSDFIHSFVHSLLESALCRPAGITPCDQNSGQSICKVSRCAEEEVVNSTGTSQRAVGGGGTGTGSS